MPASNRTGLSRFIGVVLLAWLAMIGFDFLWHAGLLTAIYKQPSPFLLPPERAFRLIPLGYLSFLLLAILIVWLVRRLEIATPLEGFVFGLKAGGLIWGSLTLGLLSISTAPATLLAGWFAGQTLEMAFAGVVAAAGMTSQRLRLLAFRVIAFIVVCFLLGILLQNVIG